MKIKLIKFGKELELRVQETPESFAYHLLHLRLGGIRRSQGVVVRVLALEEGGWIGLRIVMEE